MKRLLIGAVVLALLAGAAYAVSTATMTITSDDSALVFENKLYSGDRHRTSNKIQNFFNGLNAGAYKATVVWKVGTNSTQSFSY